MRREKRERGTLIALPPTLPLSPLFSSTPLLGKTDHRGGAEIAGERILLDAVGYRVPFCRFV